MVGLAEGFGSEYFYVDYSKAVNPAHLRLYDISIISPDADVDLTEGHRLGHRFYSYLGIGEVASDAPYRPFKRATIGATASIESSLKT